MLIKIKSILKQKESLTLEFKESKSKLNKDIYDTVCAFSNREAVVNILMQREYSSAFVSKLIIQKDRVVFENANKPRYVVKDAK